MEQMEQWNTPLFFEWKRHSRTFQTAYHLVERVGVLPGSYVYAHVSSV